MGQSSAEARSVAVIRSGLNKRWQEFKGPSRQAESCVPGGSSRVVASNPAPVSADRSYDGNAAARADCLAVGKPRESGVNLDWAARDVASTRSTVSPPAASTHPPDLHVASVLNSHTSML
jgi:hypothetical protein